MNPEDIIQAKEWQQLSEWEKQIVLPLAETEGEYNMLKKMLLIAREDVADVPLISPHVHARLQEQIKKPSPKISPAIWWLAAASLLAVIILTQLNNQADKTATGTPSGEIVKTTKTPPAKVDSQTINKILIENQSPDKSVVTKHNASFKDVQDKKREKVNTDINNATAIANVNVSIRNNEALLDYVTEVY